MTMGRHKVNSVQVFRGIAFLCVFLSHVPLASTGPMGVSMFLVMSGFVMSLSYDGRMETLPQGVRQSVRFGYKKIGKLYPLHLLTLALMVLYTVATLQKHGFPQDEVRNAAVALPFQVAMQQAWLPNRALYFSYNKVSWYLSLCLFTYTIFPFFFRKIKTIGKSRLIPIGGGIILLQIVASAAVSVATVGNGDWVKWVTYICPAYRALDYFIGVILGQFVAQGGRKNAAGQRWRMTVWEILYFIAVIVQIVLYTMGSVPDAIRYDIFWLPTSLIGVFLFYQKRGVLTKLLTNRLTVFIGDVSGQAFLLHQIVIGFVTLFIPNALAAAAYSLTLTVAASIIYMKLESKVLQRTPCFGKR